MRCRSWWRSPATFSQRGSIVDIFPPNHGAPIRLDFFGDEIDSMRTFDPATQRSQDRIAEFVLVPASEALPEWAKSSAASLQALDLAACDHATQQRMSDDVERILRGEHFRGIEYYMPYLYPRPATLLDYAPDNALLLVDDLLGPGCGRQHAWRNRREQLRGDLTRDGQLPPNYAVPYFTWEELKSPPGHRPQPEPGLSTDESDYLLRGRYLYLRAALRRAGAADAVRYRRASPQGRACGGDHPPVGAPVRLVHRKEPLCHARLRDRVGSGPR